jgi:putative SOS response-associated peptidase YedK
MPTNPMMAEIHNTKTRMPAILRHEDHDAWLAGNADAAMDCIAPRPQEMMPAYPVSTVVNSSRNNEPRLIEPLAGASGS